MINSLVAAVIGRFGRSKARVCVQHFVLGGLSAGVEHHSSGRYIVSLEAKIFGNKSGNKNGVAVAVGNGVENICGYTVSVIENAEKIAAVFLELYSVADILDVLKYKGIIGILFKIIPEEARLYPHVKARHPLQRSAKRFFKQQRINPLLQLNAYPKNI